MKSHLVPTFVLASFLSVGAMADEGLMRSQPAPGFYKDDNGYVASFPGGDTRLPMSRPFVTEGVLPPAVVTSRQRALVPESGVLQSYPVDQGVIHLEPRGYNIEGSRDPLR